MTSVDQRSEIGEKQPSVEATPQQMDRIKHDLPNHPEFMEMTLDQILAFYRKNDALEDHEEIENTYKRPEAPRFFRLSARRRQ